MAHVGLSLRDATTLRVLTDDVVKTSEIEGEGLNRETVRSSIARRLGLDIGALARRAPACRRRGRHDARRHRRARAAAHARAPLRLACGALPDRLQRLAPVGSGTWRDDAAGPMQVVCGPIGRREVHFEAPPAPRLEAEMARFLEWFELSAEGDRLVHAGLAHL